MNEKRRTPEVIALIILFLSITLFTVVGFSQDWKPTVASQHGVGVDGVIGYLLLTTGAILIIGTIVFVAFLWKYGRGLPTGSPQTSHRTERRWTLVPIIGMAAVAEIGVLVKGVSVCATALGTRAAAVLLLLDWLFLGTVGILSGWVVGALSWWVILVANALVVAAMGAWILRRHPELRARIFERTAGAGN